MIVNDVWAGNGNPETTESSTFDYLLLGGGLQSGLIALALHHYQPQASVAIVERANRLAGNHTWSFHASDVSPAAEPWIDSVIEYQWPDYEVKIGSRNRHVGLGYRTVSSQHFANTIERLFIANPNNALLLNATVVSTDAGGVRLADGRRLCGRCVIDNRGPRSDIHPSDLRDTFPGGFQKFWGFELRLPVDWPLARPVIMDDRIDQTDGFRFIYSLPFQPRRVLVEDTRFSDSPELQRSECFHQVDGYVRRITGGKLGIEHCEILREEHGVLPMPYAGFHRSTEPSRGTMAGGYRGGWFHAATGYSFPLALRLADLVATKSVEQLPQVISAEIKSQRFCAHFSRFLNRLLFRLVKPDCRYQIFRRFYRVLSEQRIARFYAHRFTPLDAARIVIGVPPGGLRPIRFLRSFFANSPQRNRSQSTPMTPGNNSATAIHVEDRNLNRSVTSNTTSLEEVR